MKTVKKLLIAMSMCMVLALCIPSLIPDAFGSITAEAATKVKINKKKATLYVGKTIKLKVKGTKSKVKWSSNKKSVATVTSNGKVKAKKKGTATITAKVNGKKYKCKITVKNKTIPIKRIELSSTSLQGYVGSTGQLSVTIYPANTTDDKTVVWSSSNPAIASVDQKGFLVAKAVGTATIKAKVGKKIATCSITVLSPYSVSIKNALAIDAAYDKISISVTNNGVSNIYLGNYSDLEERYMKVYNALAGSQLYQTNKSGYCLLPATTIAPGETKIITVGYLFVTKGATSYYSTYHLSSSSYFEIPIYENYNGTLTLHTETCYVSQ